MVHEIKDKADLDSQLESAGDSQLVVIDFHATWCGPCKGISPFFKQLSEKFPDVMFLKVDVDKVEEVATMYNVSNIPKFVFIRNNLVIEELLGANQDKLRTMVLINTKTPPDDKLFGQPDEEGNTAPTNIEFM